MFEGRIAAGPLDQFTTNATGLVDEAKLHLESNGLHLRAVDPANVALLDEHLYQPTFESYEAPHGGTLGVNLQRLSDILGFAESDTDPVNLSLSTETRKLHVTVSGVEYTMALIDPDELRAEPNLPNLDLPAILKFEWHEFGQAIRAADMVSDRLHIRVDPDPVDADAPALQFNAASDTDDITVTVTDDDYLDDPDVTGPADSWFSLNYLKDIRPAFTDDAPIRLHVGQENPFFIKWAYADGGGSVTYMVAPRISD